MKYKGYTGLVELEEGSDVLFGRVIGLRDVITFQGESVAEVTQAFHDSVDDYLEFCAERGEEPEKPYSGQFVLRLPPSLHRELANLAAARSTSLNSLIESVLKKNIGHGAEQGSPSEAKASPTKASPAKRARPALPSLGRASVGRNQIDQLKAEENRFIKKQTRAIVEAMQALGVSKSKKGQSFES
jgi:predicted HicB family RNase H-like nuclease